MPEYLICIKENDRRYCWNQETCQLEEITAKPIAISKCPENVVLEIMKNLGHEAKASREQKRGKE